MCQIKKQNAKMTLKQLQETAKRDLGLEIGISTLSEILKDQAKWTQADSSTTYSRMPTSSHIVLEKALIEWIARMDSINGFITEEIIIVKAKEFGEKLEIRDLKFSNGWLYRFKNRYNLKMRVLHGEAASMTDDNVVKFRQEMLTRLEGFDPEVLLNMDETGLFFQSFPTRTISTSEKKGVKQSKVRITVALCSNATGSIKIKPFLIGHSKKPRCFKDFNVGKYCHYYANKKAWMTTELFNNFLEHLSRELKPHNKEFILLMDNAPSHVLTTEYKNIKVITLPKNSTAHLQPMDAGIIRNFKLYYRKKLIIDYMASLDREKQFSVDLKKAVLMIHNSWNQVKPETIKNCFRKTGIIRAFGQEILDDINLIENDAVIKQYSKDLDELGNEEKAAETEQINEDQIIALFQDHYEVDEQTKEAENGSPSSAIKPHQILDAIDILLETKMADNQFSVFLPSETVRDLKDMKEEVEEFISANTRQSTLHDFAK